MGLRTTGKPEQQAAARIVLDLAEHPACRDVPHVARTAAEVREQPDRARESLRLLVVNLCLALDRARYAREAAERRAGLAAGGPDVDVAGEVEA